MRALEIRNLQVEVTGRMIINRVDLTLKAGEIHALMGPNGSGKSTLANALMGDTKCKITSGSITVDGKDLTLAKANERAKAGLFLSFQYPIEVSGLSLHSFLRTAVNNQRDESAKYSVVDFYKLLQEKMKLLGIDSSFSRRDLNAGLSGGEKKRNEMLQLSLLEPKYALLDEIDSGLDVDAIRLVAEQINRIKAKTGMAILLITHYSQFLEFLQPDKVSIIHEGRIIKQGGYELAQEINREGFAGIGKVALEKLE
ncbi:MAG TPA: Fe-S cluster assembly ATPase SufC [Candidatus Nanoarchaeia archaeon]|nr:Fe-S cluster assembly ATPase SufC [Candidatus Nanoarchaeia archaeon]